MAARLAERDGDARDAAGEGVHLLTHVANNVGGWGKGFSGAVAERWPRVEKDYRDWYAALGSTQPPAQRLGAILVTHVVHKPAFDLFVASLVAQDGYSEPGFPAIRYESLERCLGRLKRSFSDKEVFPATPVGIHMPWMGCGLGGGTRSALTSLLNKVFTETDPPILIYSGPDSMALEQ